MENNSFGAFDDCHFGIKYDFTNGKNGQSGGKSGNHLTYNLKVKTKRIPIEVTKQTGVDPDAPGTVNSAKWSERQDSNLRLRGPKPRALARLSYAPNQNRLMTNRRRRSLPGSE